MQVSDTGSIEKAVEKAIAANPVAVAEFKAGKQKALGALVGAVIATFTVTPVLASFLLPERVKEVETMLVRVLRRRSRMSADRFDADEPEANPGS